MKDKEGMSDEETLEFFKSGDWRLKLQEKSLFFYKGEDISPKLYTSKMDEISSLFSAKAPLRRALIPYQREFFKEEKGLILEGRDCGTVVFPEAPLKIYMEAGDKARARRRSKDRKLSEKEVLEAQNIRDERDKKREFAPLLRPKGSILLDSSGKSPEELLEGLLPRVKKVFF